MKLIVYFFGVDKSETSVIGPNARSAYSTAFSSEGVGAITNPIGSPHQVQFYGIFSF
jgi:hypothetical protein